MVLFDAAHGHALCTCSAHHSTLAAIAVSARGEMLATASEKGTVVRVHSVPACTLLHVFRRGTMRASIHSLAFSVVAGAEPASTSRRGLSGRDPAEAERILPGHHERVGTEAGGEADAQGVVSVGSLVCPHTDRGLSPDPDPEPEPERRGRRKSVFATSLFYQHCACTPDYDPNHDPDHDAEQDPDRNHHLGVRDILDRDCARVATGRGTRGAPRP